MSDIDDLLEMITKVGRKKMDEIKDEARLKEVMSLAREIYIHDRNIAPEDAVKEAEEFCDYVQERISIFCAAPQDGNEH
jgi:hypothetical protein